ncbi:MAG: hypothetical protein KDA91_04910 [Planctomycetaceae bacterium]|nr:hypothetical protein [Planctomycetaceae bacterium]
MKIRTLPKALKHRVDFFPWGAIIWKFDMTLRIPPGQSTTLRTVLYPNAAA